MVYYIKRKKKTQQKASEVAKKRSKPDLVKKLDKVFALYIRLRDVMPNGYGRCISCGNIKHFSDLDCGHFYSRKHMGTRFDEDNCSAECKYCLTPDALILTDDLRWVRLGDMSVGDGVFAFEEERHMAPARYWRKGVVTHIHRDVQDVYDVELENGDHIKTTAEHQWLARKRCNSSYAWVMTKDLWFNGFNVQGKKKTGPHTENTCSTVCKPFLVVQKDESHEAGWLAGMIDADGKLRPLKMSKVDINKLGMIRSRYDTKVKKVTYIGKSEIVVMETDTHTFIANGYAMHNCNRFSADHLINYQTNLIRKIGMARFELLGVKSRSVKKWDDFELEQLIRHYTAEVRRMSADKGISVSL